MQRKLTAVLYQTLTGFGYFCACNMCSPNPVRVKLIKNQYTSRLKFMTNFNINWRKADTYRVTETFLTTKPFEENSIIKNEKLLQQVNSINHTKQKLAFETSQDCGQNFATLFHESLDAIVLVDALTCEILLVNRVVKRLFGYEENKIIGQKFAILFPVQS
ncbi:MAG: PAS domain S-box protein, partial [bacterium]